MLTRLAIIKNAPVEPLPGLVYLQIKYGLSQVAWTQVSAQTPKVYRGRKAESMAEVPIWVIPFGAVSNRVYRNTEQYISAKLRHAY